MLPQEGSLSALALHSVGIGIGIAIGIETNNPQKPIPIAIPRAILQTVVKQWSVIWSPDPVPAEIDQIR
jgi:hypothetical protein